MTTGAYSDGVDPAFDGMPLPFEFVPQCARPGTPMLGSLAQEVSAMRSEDEDTRAYSVVMNDEEQYSIWFADRDLPLGWRAVGKTGTKTECLAFIKEVWTDMRPRSLRTWMEERERVRS